MSNAGQSGDAERGSRAGVSPAGQSGGGGDRDELASDDTDGQSGDAERGSRACQRGGGRAGARARGDDRLPWSDAARAGDKTRLWNYVVSEPDGLPLPAVVAEVLNSAEAGDADYQLARRFFARHSEYFNLTNRDAENAVLWVSPTVEALHLSQQYANAKTSGRRGGGVSDGRNWGETGGHRAAGDGDDCGTDGVDGLPGDDDGADCRTTGTRPTPQFPKGRAQSIMSDNVVFDGSDDGHDYRSELLRELGVERENQQDKFKLMRRVRGSGSDYLLLPYLTRFNSPERAASVRSGFETALRRAGGAYSDAVVVTLTTDSKRFDGLDAAVSNLYESKSRLLSWLSTDYRLGYRPDNLSVLEFTESGLPHVHVVLFGLNWAVPQSVLSQKWDDYGQGSVVDIRSARRRGDDWLLHNDDGGTATLRQYLGKAIRGLQTLAETDAGDVRDAADDGDVSLWRQALYWATERQYYSCSPSLKPDTDDDGLPHVTLWEFVGVAQYRELPGHVRANARVLARGWPPPDGRDGGQSDTSTASTATT
jgi:hypothetical protein